jgi:phenylalanyl-tRNA synthetase alpha chain
VDWEAHAREAEEAFGAASTLDELEAANVAYLGRRSPLKLALREVRDRETGMTLNAIRERIEGAAATAAERVEAAHLARRLAEEKVDVTLPARLLGDVDPRPRGSLHPTTIIRRDVEDAFIGLGYEIRDDREVETVEYNFDKLAFPWWHPARSPRDTYFLDANTVLRTETSASQIHAMEERKPPIYMVSIGRVYRRDAINQTHYPIFHQFEGLAVDRHITMADLKGTLLHVMRALFGEDRRVRFRTNYFPFTEPSMEPDVSCGVCGGEGCATCKWSGWIEIGGCGMVDPQVLLNVGLDPDEWSGFAFGLGLERTAQLRFDIPTIRPFWENDLRFLRQFR